MKLTSDTTEITLGNVEMSGEFRIRNSAKAFKILSDGLYSNKIRAVIRELSCNAYDSHVAAGKKEQPFEVHLPTILEPWFGVRDFGIGLNHDDVINIYTTYFESTKTNSNDFVGALGLGSKSPFSYTENFTVTAIKDGRQGLYSAFLNENGVPSIALLSQSETDEANGVEVKFSVTEKNDFYHFEQEVARVLKFFDTKPTITGKQFTIYPVEFTQENIAPGMHIWAGKSVAVMGNIPYPIHNIAGNVMSELGDLGYMLGCSLYINFDIGELEFAASREELSYTAYTIQNIKKKLIILRTNLEAYIESQVKDITNQWEKAAALYELSRSNLLTASVRSYVAKTNFKYLTDHYHRLQLSEITLKKEYLIKHKITINAFSVSYGNHVSMYSMRKRYIQNSALQEEYFGFLADSNYTFVLNDLKVGCLARAKYHYRQHSPKGDIICVSIDIPDLAERMKAYQQLLDDIGNPPNVVKASTLDKPEPKKTETKSVLVLTSKKSSYYSDSYDSHSWSGLTVDFSDQSIKHYYVPLSNFTPLNDNGDPLGDFFNTMTAIRSANIKGLSDIPIYGIRKSAIKEFEQLDNLVPFMKHLPELVKKLNKKDLMAGMVIGLLDKESATYYNRPDWAIHLDPTSLYAKVNAKLGKIDFKNSSIKALSTFVIKYGDLLNLGQFKIETEAMIHELKATYPLLQHARYAPDTELVNYIRLVDQSMKTTTGEVNE